MNMDILRGTIPKIQWSKQKQTSNGGKFEKGECSEREMTIERWFGHGRTNSFNPLAANRFQILSHKEEREVSHEQFTKFEPRNISTPQIEHHISLD